VKEKRTQTVKIKKAIATSLRKLVSTHSDLPRLSLLAASCSGYSVSSAADSAITHSRRARSQFKTV